MKKHNLILLLSCFALIIEYTSCKPERPVIPANTGGSGGTINRSPIAKAGDDTLILLPVNSVKLKGTGSYDPDNDNITYKWTRLNGPGTFTIVNPDSLITNVTNLVQGIYEFALTVKDLKGAIGVDMVLIHVNPGPPPPPPPPPGNRPPSINPVEDRIVHWPADSSRLYGGVYDPDYNIATIRWTKVAGPGSFNILQPDSAITRITNLEKGVYRFEIKVVDSAGLSAKDTTTVIVGELPANPQEIILDNQVWACHWDCSIQINRLYNHVPANRFFKVFIKRNNSSNWVEVVPWQEMTISSVYGFGLQKGTLWIYDITYNYSDTPDIKFVY
jgi:hypothetical protein